MNHRKGSICAPSVRHIRVRESSWAALLGERGHGPQGKPRALPSCLHRVGAGLALGVARVA